MSRPQSLVRCFRKELANPGMHCPGRPTSSQCGQSIDRSSFLPSFLPSELTTSLRWAVAAQYWVGQRLEQAMLGKGHQFPFECAVLLSLFNLVACVSRRGRRRRRGGGGGGGYIRDYFSNRERSTQRSSSISQGRYLSTYSDHFGVGHVIARLLLGKIMVQLVIFF